MPHATRHIVSPYLTWWGVIENSPASLKNSNAWTNISPSRIRQPLVQQLVNQNATFTVVTLVFYTASGTDSYKHLPFYNISQPTLFYLLLPNKYANLKFCNKNNPTLKWYLKTECCHSTKLKWSTSRIAMYIRLPHIISLIILYMWYYRYQNSLASPVTAKKECNTLCQSYWAPGPRRGEFLSWQFLRYLRYLICQVLGIKGISDEKPRQLVLSNNFNDFCFFTILIQGILWSPEL